MTETVLSPARVISALVCIGAMVAGSMWWPRAQSVWERGMELCPLAWMFGAAGLIGSYLLRSERLRAEWSAHPAARPLACLRITLLHNAALNLLPMRAGELGYPWLLHRHWGIAWADSAGSLLRMRVQDAIVLTWLALITWAVVAIHTGSRAPMVGLSVALAATSGILAVAHAWRHERLLSWGLSAGNWLLKLGTCAAILASLGDIGALTSWCGALAGEAAAVLPIQAPAGFGSYEAAIALGTRVVTPAASIPDLLAAALVMHLFAIVVALAGAALANLLIATAVPPAAC